MSFYLYPPSLLTPAPFLSIISHPLCPGSGLQPTDGTGTNRLPSSLLSLSHPNYTHHPSNASISPNPVAFPLNTTWPWPAAQNSHGPGSHEQERVTSLMGTQCTMSDAHCVPVHSASRLCGGTNPMPLARQHEASASSREKTGFNTKNDPIKLQKRYSIHSM